MRKTRRFCSALVLAVVMAGGLVTTLEAKDKGGSGTAAICAYLSAIIEYPYTSPTIRTLALSLYAKYGCTQ